MTSPKMSAEYLDSPQTHALIQHMGVFASLLLGQLLQGGGWSSKWGDTGGIGPDAGYDPPGPDYSGIPKGAGPELKGYMRDEAKRRAQDTSAGFESLSTDDQRRYLDGIRDGSIRQDSGSWQRGLEDDRRDAQIQGDVNTQVYGSPAGEGGPDVASAPKGGMRARAE